MPPTTENVSNFISRLVWTSTGNLELPNHKHEDVLFMLKWERGLDLRINTGRWPLPNKLSKEQKELIKGQLEEQIKATFSHKAPPLPAVSFPAGQQNDHRMVDFYYSPRGEVEWFELKNAVDGFTILDGQGLGFMLGLGNVLERNEQLLRIKDLPAEHVSTFVDDREALLRDVVGLDARIKDIWALDDADGAFSNQVDVLVALPGEEDAVTAAHDWPGWLLWEGKLLQLTYRNRFAYCSHCKNSGSSERHLRKDCEVAPPMEVDDEDSVVDDGEPEYYDDDYDEYQYEDEDFWYGEGGAVYDDFV